MDQSTQSSPESLTSHAAEVRHKTFLHFPSRKEVVRLVIWLLCISAALGIITVVIGGVSGVGGQVMLTTAEIDVTTILALCYVGIAYSKIQRYIQIGGFAVDILALLSAISLTWVPFDSWPDWLWRTFGVGCVLSVAAAHACLVLPSLNFNLLLKRLVTATLVCLVVAAAMITYLIVGSTDNLGDWFYRLLGVILILDVLGTILIPIIRKTNPHTTPPTT